MSTIGCIGLGIMGSRMAANLQKVGHSLMVYNRTPEKATTLVNQGATWANSIQEIAQHSDRIITMLSTPEAVKEVALGNEGLLSHMKNNALWINCSTIDPATTITLGDQAKHYGIRYLDAPVAGTKTPAEKGELLFLVGGATTDILEAQPLFDCMGKKTLHLGTIGKGAMMKILINQLLAQSLVAFSEALVMGEAMGIKKDVVLDTLLSTPVVAPILAAIRPKLEQEDYEPNFPLKWMQKDLQLSSITAYEAGIATPSLHTAKELFAQAKQQGYGDLDFSAIYDYLNKR